MSRSGVLPDVGACLDWIEDRRANTPASIRPIPFEQLACWSPDSRTGNWVHDSGRFFSIVGLRVSDWPAGSSGWDQPILLQDEIGLLGFLAKKIDGRLHLLVQAKIEPGNVNLVQLSPTVQATRSNYSRVHGGRTPRYLAYFHHGQRRPVRLDQFQSEQGARFLDKLNRNLIVEVPESESVELHEDYQWMTLGQIKSLSRVDNCVNMDSRSVLSCLDFFAGPESSTPSWEYPVNGFGGSCLMSMRPDSISENSMADILAWIVSTRYASDFEARRIDLRELADWSHSSSAVSSDRHNFSVMAVDVEIGNREVIHWTQPMMRQHRPELFGFVTQMRQGVLHFLMRMHLEAGLRSKAELGPTVQTDFRQDVAGASPWAGEFQALFDGQAAEVHLDSMQSEEGGRFYHEQNRNMVVELASTFQLDITDSFRWMTLHQIMQLARHSNYLNIQARSVLSLLSLQGSNP